MTAQELAAYFRKEGYGVSAEQDGWYSIICQESWIADFLVEFCESKGLRTERHALLVSFQD